MEGLHDDDRSGVITREQILDCGYRGVTLLSDLHAGRWEEIGYAEETRAAVRGIVENAVRERHVLIVNGDQIDEYGHVPNDARAKEAGELSTLLAPAHARASNGCPSVIVLPGNHDPKNDEKRFLAIDNILVHHGHLVEGGRIWALIEELRQSIPHLQHRPNAVMTSDVRRDIVQALNGDVSLLHEQQTMEEGVYKPVMGALGPWRRVRHILEQAYNTLVRLTGWIAHVCTVGAERIVSPAAHAMWHRLVRLFDLTIAQLASDVAAALGFDAILCAHDHAPSLKKRRRPGGRRVVYGNSGSLCQVGLRKTFLSVDLQKETAVRLQRIDARSGDSHVISEEAVERW